MLKHDKLSIGYTYFYEDACKLPFLNFTFNDSQCQRTVLCLHCKFTLEDMIISKWLLISGLDYWNGLLGTFDLNTGHYSLAKSFSLLIKIANNKLSSSTYELTKASASLIASLIASANTELHAVKKND